MLDPPNHHFNLFHTSPVEPTCYASSTLPITNQERTWNSAHHHHPLGTPPVLNLIQSPHMYDKLFNHIVCLHLNKSLIQRNPDPPWATQESHLSLLLHTLPARLQKRNQNRYIFESCTTSKKYDC